MFCRLNIVHTVDAALGLTRSLEFLLVFTKQRCGLWAVPLFIAVSQALSRIFIDVIPRYQINWNSIENKSWYCIFIMNIPLERFVKLLPVIRLMSKHLTKIWTCLYINQENWKEK